MTKHLKTPWFIPSALIIFFVVVSLVIVATKPKAQRGTPPPEHAIVVEVEKIKSQTFTPYISSYGKVSPLTQTSLTPRVTGVVESISANARTGARFNKGDVLITLEQEDYKIEKRVAYAKVAEAESVLANEIALGEEAKHNWKASGRTGAPPPLALREPQLRAAEAALESAKASAQRADLNLSRTTIRAPYDGFVLNLNADIGEQVSVNTPLLEIFSAEAAEISLPLKTIDLPFIPLNLINSDAAPAGFGSVTIQSTTTSKQMWQGTLVRGAHAVDNQSRQLHVIARIETPFDSTPQNSGLKVEEYIVAKIQGIPAENIVIAPNKAIYQNSYLYVFENGKVNRRDVTLGWRDNEVSIITSGLNSNDQLVLTPLGQVPSGTLAVIKDKTTGDTP